MRFISSARCAMACMLVFAASHLAHAADITDEECTKFARRLESLAKAGNAAAIQEMVDWDTLVDRASKGLKMSDADKAGCKTAWAGTVFEKAICDIVAHGGSYHFLHNKDTADGKRAVFRLLLPTHGVNYHEFVLARNDKGELRIIDFYVYLAGELISDTLHTGLLQALANPGLVARLTGQENAFVQSFPTITKMRAALAAQEFRKVIDLDRTLPEEIQHNSMVLILRAQAASHLGETETTAVFEDFKKYQPNNSAIDLLALDYYYARKDYPATRKAMGRLSKRLGGDPYLVLLAGISFGEEGKLDQAAKFIQQSLDQEPTSAAGYFARMEVALRQKDFPAVRTALTALEANTPVRMSVSKIKQIPDYAEFVKSDEFKKWVGNRPAAAEKSTSPDAPAAP